MGKKKVDLSNLHSELLNTNLRYGNINLMFLSQVYIAESAIQTYSSFNKIKVIKRFSLENIIKFIHYIFSTKPRQKVPEGKVNLIFINEVNNTAMIDTLRSVSKKFEKKAYLEVISDYRINREEFNSYNIFNNFQFFQFVLAIVKLMPKLFFHYKELLKVTKAYNLNLILLVFNIFDSVLIITLTQNLFKSLSFSKVVLNSDVHKLSRAIVLIAKKKNISTYILQHGATNLEYGFLPISADKMLLWGEESQNWFVKRHQSLKKLKIVGSPRMDEVIYRDSHNISISKIKYILVALNPIGYENVRQFLTIVKESILESKLPSSVLIIKLHPGSDDYKELPDLVFKDSELIYQVEKNTNIISLLKLSQVVITTTSSVGLEAIVLNKPLIQVKINAYPLKMAYELYDCCFNVSKKEEIRNLLTDIPELCFKIKNYPRFVEKYFYKLDGNSSNRAKYFIENN